ncbi:MAG: restriction endonuclease, partial [Gammaproteobacteria bacterium]
MKNISPQAQGPLVDLALQTLGWKAFQDLCAQICEEILQQPVAIYREAQDGGQDAVFLFKKDKTNAGIGTVQCKFTSDPKRRIKPSDLSQEKNSVKELVKKGQADTYFLITNMGVDAPIAAEIRNELNLLGVNNAQVFGREWISQKIRESSRLRALVPRVYGLGDLSIILDERKATQTRAL